MASSCKTNKSSGQYDSVELANSVPNYVLFNYDSTKLDAPAISSLNKQADWLKANTNIKVLIEGHCDERGTREYNLALGAKRASTVQDYLVGAGVAADRIVTITYGKERPFMQGTGEEVWAQNRRAITAVN